MSELTETIEENGAQPKRVTVDGNSAEQHSLKEQIEADRYLKAQAAANTPRRGLIFTRFRHQGTV